MDLPPYYHRNLFIYWDIEFEISLQNVKQSSFVDTYMWSSHILLEIMFTNIQYTSHSICMENNKAIDHSKHNHYHHHHIGPLHNYMVWHGKYRALRQVLAAIEGWLMRWYKRAGVRNMLHIYPKCGIFYKPSIDTCTRGH